MDKFGFLKAVEIDVDRMTLVCLAILLLSFGAGFGVCYLWLKVL